MSAKINEIRITNPPPALFTKISKDAAKNKRSVAKQAEFIIEQYYQTIKVVFK